MPSSNALLSIEHLRAGYGARVVLNDVSLNCGRGEIVGLLGPNGAGKSTLLKAVAGLVPLLGGRVEFDGRPIDRASTRTRLAYVPQRSEVDWDFPISVEEVVLLGRQGRLGLLGRPRAADRAAAQVALDRLGLSPLAGERIGELSGGQQQRVFLARALAQEADVLLLDEPLTGVDATTQAAVLDLLGELRSAGHAILLSTHDLAQAAKVCDRLVLLNGSVIAQGGPSEVIRPEVLVATYGGGLLSPDEVAEISGLAVPPPHGGGPEWEEIEPGAHGHGATTRRRPH